MHIHIYSANGEAKFWIEPAVELARNYGLSSQELTEIRSTIEERSDEIADSWRRHFAS